jgi:hypothetical protein
MKVNLIGGGFQHAYSSTWWKKPTYFEYVKNKLESDISIYIDDSIVYGLQDRKSKTKFGWLSESKLMVPNITKSIIENYKSVLTGYDMIFTHNKDILKLDNKFKFIVANGFWIEKPEIYKKTRIVSMIMSDKRMFEGHIYRHKISEKFKGKIDLFGRGKKEIKIKEEGLKDYMFSIAIENCQYSSYFTEKIMDCFATGTIPIYWGTNDINEFFNKDGIIILNDDFKIEDINEELYYSKLDAVKENFERVMQYEIPEDTIYQKYIKKDGIGL